MLTTDKFLPPRVQVGPRSPRSLPICGSEDFKRMVDAIWTEGGMPSLVEESESRG